MLDALLAQEALHTLDLVARVLQQVADALQELHVTGPIEPPSAPALHGLELWELGLPEAQHVFLDAQLDRHLADIAKCFHRL